MSYRQEIVGGYFLLARPVSAHSFDVVYCVCFWNKQIEFVDSIPKTVSGKTRRAELRNKEWNKPEA